MIHSLLSLGPCIAAIGAVCPPGTAPTTVVVATSRGEWEIPVFEHRGHPALPAPQIEAVLPVSSSVRGGEWVTVSFAGEPFRFLLDAPLMEHRDQIIHLVGGAYSQADTLYLPLQWLSVIIPSVFSEGYRYDPIAARFEEASLAPVLTRVSPPQETQRSIVQAAPSVTFSAPNEFGLRLPHTVVVDPGHGGEDEGNPGLYLPRGVREKHITLGLGRELQRALAWRDISVVMTRTNDRRIDLSDRAAVCVGDCDLFVSIHVDALPPGPGYTEHNGVHTYIWGGSQTANARRVAAMGNQALQYEAARESQDDDALAYIMRDLQVNEHQRESSILATAVQLKAAAIHPGEDHGVEQANYAVLRAARRPAILIETGFATNRRDAEFLNSPRGQRVLAEAIAEGILEYLRLYESKILTSARP